MLSNSLQFSESFTKQVTIGGLEWEELIFKNYVSDLRLTYYVLDAVNEASCLILTLSWFYHSNCMDEDSRT